MRLMADEIRLTHRIIGSKHVFTSPDVPELHVSNASEAAARDSIQSALDVIADMKARIEAVEEISKVRKKRYA